MTEVVAKISRNRLVQEFITFQLLLNSPNYLINGRIFFHVFGLYFKKSQLYCKLF